MITPSYNQADFLEETIRSVLLQDYHNLDYFIIDGGSTDASVDIIRRYEAWLDGWVSEPDRGQSDAINKGFRRGTGEIVAWLNSDDRFAPGALDRVAPLFERSSDLVLVYGDVDIIDAAGNALERRSLPDFDVAAVLEKSTIIAQPAAFIRRTASRPEGLVREDLHYAMDFDLWLSLVRRGRVEHVADHFADFRLWEQSKSGSHQLDWGPELVAIANEFFSDPTLTDAHARLRRRSMSGVHSTAGAYALQGGARLVALRSLIQAAWLFPPALWRTQLGGRLALAIFGRRVFGRLRRLTART